jgi:chromosome segregation ATPase
MKRKGADEGASLSKQSSQYRQSIERIKGETTKLRDQLCMNSLQSTNAATSSQIARLQDQGDAYLRKIQEETAKIDNLDSEIAEVQKKIELQRTTISGANGVKETNDGIVRKIKSLENKHDKAQQKLNEAIAHNKSLRNDIDKLRKERVVYDKIYQKLEDELEHKTKEMKSVVERGTQAHKEREQARKRMEELQKKAEEEQGEFETEWRELGRLIDQDRKMKEFIKQKEQTSTISDVGAEDAEEAELRRQVAKSAWAIGRDKASIKASMDKVRMYEEAFSKIQAATGITDIDELVRTFVEAEKHNYSLFNYVNELSNEMEKLEQQITEIKAEIDRYKGQGLSSDNQRRKLMHELEERLERIEIRAEHYEQSYERTMKTIGALKVGIQSIFERIGCSTEETKEVLGGTGITETNLMQYLGIIEQRTNEILQMYSACQAGNEANPMSVPSQPRNEESGLKPIRVEAPPIITDKDPMEEDEQVGPLNLEQLQKKALDRLKMPIDRILNSRKKQA